MLSQSQINIAIAECCGWKKLPSKGISAYDAACYGGVPTIWHNPKGNSEDILNYCSDLNAMHEAEKTLNQLERVDYMNTLSKVCGSEKDKAFADSNQRAEAFLRVKGLWTK